MSESQYINLAITAVLAPGVAFGVIFLFFLHMRQIARWTALAAIGLSTVCSSLLLFNVLEPSFRVEWSFSWLVGGQNIFNLGVLLDPLALVMLWVVTVISFFVIMYSFSYMEEDPRQPRFFAFISFFCFAMMGFTIAPNLFQSYIFWELVGLGSYLLIGFWYHLPSAATAARKAFVMTRFGDLGFFAAILIAFATLGKVSFTALSDPSMASGWLTPFAGGDVALWVSIGLFIAVAGKSAQFPLYGWLPDAMEGPTPVSALIHAATMVAAGVYLLARTSFLLHFGSAPTETAWHGMAMIAMLTALLSGGVAIVQSDIKRVLAYSTISQLGYMVVGIGTGAVVMGMMHLFTHAFFKALLFLTAGAFIHAAHSNEIVDIARAGGRKMKLAMTALVVGSLALAGIFPFAGFYSKDAILEHLLVKGDYGLFVFALIGVFMTAYYMFRVVFMMLSVKGEHEHEHHLHTGKWMVLPLSLLTVGAIFSGNIWKALQPMWFEVEHAEAGNAVLITTAASTLLALLGIFYAARVFYWRKATDPMAYLPRLAVTLKEKWYLDHGYWWVVRIIYLPFTYALQLFETWGVKGALDGIGKTCMGVARGFARLQSGEVQQYLALVFAAVAAVLFVVNQLRAGF
jgi:NADH-quinone oxidoreductase subunit L